MASHGQTQFQGHVPNQSQNVGQQRQVPIGHQQFQGQQQPKGNQLQTQQQALYNSYDPQLALFTLEKPKGAKNWEDAAPEQQHVTLQDIQNELTKFRRKRGNVAQALREITSSNCRRIINELVTSETEELWKYNKSIQFRIASINIDWEKISRSSRQIKRVEVILETEPSRFQEPVQMKPMAGMNPTFAQDGPKGPKQGLGPQMQPGQVPHMLQGPKPNAAPHMAHGQPQPQGVSAQNAPPPPPPPGHGGHVGGPISGAPPPPPPGPGHNMHGAPMPKAAPHGRGAMPGAFPEPMVMPMPSVGRGHGVQPHIMDRGMLKKQKKGKHHHGSISSASSSSSTSSASDWESDSDSSSSGPVRVSHVEQGDYNMVDRRDPSRHSKKHRKSHKHRSDSRMRSRSRSRSVPRLGRSGHIDMSSRKRRDSAMIDPPPMGRHSGYSSKDSSPRLAHSQLHGQPQQVHIHVNTNNSSDEKEHDPERPRLRQSSTSSPSASFFKDKRKLEKLDTALPMSRESSASWERGSGTASWTNSSAYAPDDIVFDKPERRPSLNRGHSRTQSYPYPHDSHIYDDVDLQHRSNIQRVRHLPADDYPHNHRSYFSERPLPHRRGSAQATSVNPFATPHYPPKPHRSMSYAAEAHEPYTALPQQRYLTEHSDREDTFDMQDMVEALKHVKESRRASAAPALQRRATVGREDFYTRDEEWDARYGGNAMRYGRYV